MHGAPRAATLMVKHDKLYYIFYGKQMIKKSHGLVQQHAAVLKPALEDNLRRWARGGTGRTKRDQLERQPIGLTDREYYEQSHGKLFTEF